MVAAINGQVGEMTSPGGLAGATAQAPGSTAPQSAGASTGFITLSEPGGSAIVAPFAEVDAARLVTGQPVTVTFDALPDVSLTGSVVAIAPEATIVSTVVDYNVTISLDHPDQRLRPGMTANALVSVGEKDNVLMVPNVAIQLTNGQAAVLLLVNRKLVATNVTTGLVGDAYTEITGGLSAGDKLGLWSNQQSTRRGMLFQMFGGGRGGGLSARGHHQSVQDGHRRSARAARH